MYQVMRGGDVEGRGSLAEKEDKVNRKEEDVEEIRKNGNHRTVTVGV